MVVLASARSLRSSALGLSRTDSLPVTALRACAFAKPSAMPAISALKSMSPSHPARAASEPATSLTALSADSISTAFRWPSRSMRDCFSLRSHSSRSRLAAAACAARSTRARSSASARRCSAALIAAEAIQQTNMNAARAPRAIHTSFGTAAMSTTTKTNRTPAPPDPPDEPLLTVPLRSPSAAPDVRMPAGQNDSCHRQAIDTAVTDQPVYQCDRR